MPPKTKVKGLLGNAQSGRGDFELRNAQRNQVAQIFLFILFIFSAFFTSYHPTTLAPPSPVFLSTNIHVELTVKRQVLLTYSPIDHCPVGTPRLQPTIVLSDRKHQNETGQ